MTRHPIRSALLFVIALAALSGTAYAAQQVAFTPPPAVQVIARPQLVVPAVPAPAPVAAPTAPGSAVPVVDGQWARRTARQAGIPLTALTAYARATLMAPKGCGVGWTTIAGIGWVESQHGTIAGRTLNADGTSSTPILGPELNGVGPVAAIAATQESTSFHGNPTWDHAVGPMQFIPSSWSDWASDGDGDGTESPNDIDDAAFATARYLCADGRNLTTGEGWSGGIFSYNHAQAYVDAVHAAASAYAQRTA